jgi:altronate dehydratase
LVREVHVSIGLGCEVLQQLANAMTTKDLEAMEDADLQRLAEQLWRWHDEALRELLKRGHVVPKQK